MIARIKGDTLQVITSRTEREMIRESGKKSNPCGEWLTTVILNLRQEYFHEHGKPCKTKFYTPETHA